MAGIRAKLFKSGVKRPDNNGGDWVACSRM